jgi:glucose-1-phosphate thymidylyltransferase
MNRFIYALSEEDVAKMKGLILSSGYGTRLRPLTYSQQKQLIPVANRPILFYAIEDVIEAGATKIGIIVGPNKVRETVESEKWDVEIDFLYQDEPRGLAHTILVAKEFLDELFVMYLGDNICQGTISNWVGLYDSDNSEIVG